MNRIKAVNGDSPWTVMRVLLVGASVVVIIAGMRVAASLITSLFFAFVISVSVAPIQGWLHRKGLPVWLAFILVALAVMIFMLLLVGVIVVSIDQFINALPTYQERLAEVRQSVRDTLSSYGINVNDILDLETFQTENMMGFIKQSLMQVSQALSQWGFILFLAAFMVLEAVGHPAKLMKALRAGSPMPERLEAFNKDIRSYIAINAWIGLLCGSLNAIFLFVLGVDFPLLWGAFSFLMSFIPMVGFVVSMIPPAFLALLEFGVLKAIIVIAGFILINTVTDNIIYPRVIGRGLNLAPLMVILSVFFWSWVLGPLGAILAVPITLMVKSLILESSEESRWLAVLMEPAPAKDAAP